jgi:hypothetical protein
LVQFPAGVGVEQDAGAVVAQAGFAGVRAQVPCGRPPRRSGLAMGDERGAVFAAADQAGQQMRGARCPVDPFGVPALGGDFGSSPGEVEVVDVQGQDLAGPGGGLVEHPPQGLFS